MTSRSTSNQWIYQARYFRSPVIFQWHSVPNSVLASRIAYLDETVQNLNMKSAIWGSGAIGGVVGAGIAAGGEDVLLVDIVPEHVDAMNKNGLLVKSATDSFRALRRPQGISISSRGPYCWQPSMSQSPGLPPGRRR